MQVVYINSRASALTIWNCQSTGSFYDKIEQIERVKNSWQMVKFAQM